MIKIFQYIWEPEVMQYATFKQISNSFGRPNLCNMKFLNLF